jgi:hypothetical protein
VRPGASAAAYTIVLPRQLLRAAPEALRSASSATAPWSGLTGVPAGFADGVDNGVTSVGSGTGLTGGPITGSGTLSVDGSVVQLRVIGTCASGAISAIASNGSVTCASGGSGVTQVATGAGLTGGPITTTGTVAVANKGITTALIADNAIGLGQINTSQVQARITGSCAVGKYFRGVAADGTVLCEPLPGVFTISVADDPAPKVGTFLSMTIGSDGVPVMAHANGQDPSFALRVTHCNDVACSGNNETSTDVDTSSAQTGLYPSIAIGADGNPVIAYRNNTTGALWVAKCNDPACTGGDETRTQVAAKSGFSGYAYTSIALGTDTFPVIAYSDFDTNTMKVAKCNDTACAGANETITDQGVPGRAKVVRIGLDGNPVIAYELISSFALAVTKCNDAACAGNNETTTTVDDTANILAGNVAMVVRFSGRPLVVYSDSTSATLRVADCDDVACTGAERDHLGALRQRQVDRRHRRARARGRRRWPAGDRVPQHHRRLGALRAVRGRPLQSSAPRATSPSTTRASRPGPSRSRSRAMAPRSSPTTTSTTAASR